MFKLLSEGKMKTSIKIGNTIRKIPAGTTFKYQQLNLERSEFTAAAKAIERLINREEISRISNGLFYKPRITVFGKLTPNESEQLKPYLYENNKRIAYITGLSLYNRMGLSSQIPQSLQVACRSKRIIIRLGNTQVKAVKSYIDVTEKNIPLLEILDALKDFKLIPDMDKKSAIKILSLLIKKLKNNEVTKLLQYSLSYPPRVRALLSAILELVSPDVELNTLLDSLNPLTSFKFGIDKTLLITSENWNIT